MCCVHIAESLDRPHILSVWPFTLVCASAFGGRRNRRDQWYSIGDFREILPHTRRFDDELYPDSSIHQENGAMRRGALLQLSLFCHGNAFFLWWWWFSLLLYIFPLYTLFMKSDTSLDRLKDYRWRVPLWLYCASNLNRSRIPTHCRKHEQMNQLTVEKDPARIISSSFSRMIDSVCPGLYLID